MTIRRTLLALGLAALAAGCATTPAPTSITDTAAATPQLSTLHRLVTEAGLGDTLRAAGPFTVFAPTDDAFKAVPAKTMQELASNRELLKAVLTYHVVPGRLTAADVTVGNVKTVNGANLALGKAGGIVTAEDAMVIQADLPAANGVVHLVDRVLMPPKR